LGQSLRQFIEFVIHAFFPFSFAAATTAGGSTSSTPFAGENRQVK